MANAGKWIVLAVLVAAAPACGAKKAAAPAAVAPAPPPPPRPSVGVAPIPSLRFANGHIVGDWAAAPADKTCWTADSAAGPTAYDLASASAKCTTGLTLTKADVNVDQFGSVQIGNAPARGTPHTLDANGAIDTPAPSALNDADAAKGMLVSDVSGVYAVGKVTHRETVVDKCHNWPAHDQDNAYVEVDLAHETVAFVPPRNVVLPNQALTVEVCHIPGQTLTVQWGGVRGLTSSTLANNEAALAPMFPGGPEKIEPEISVFTFAPRQSGHADLTITGTGGAPADTMTVELEVDTLYWGSVRVGLGTLFDVGNIWNGYSIGTFAGSNQPEIRQSHNAVGFELVNAFAPYLLDLLTCPGRGRSYTGGCNRWFAPYIGFGLVGAGPAQNIQALSSFHFGVELEFAQSFSVALTFVERRTQALADGYHVGSPVSGGMSVADVTRDAWQPGMALVVNATPSFLQFAMGSGSGSTPGTTSTSGAGQSGAPKK